jgi:hypothetical protein
MYIFVNVDAYVLFGLKFSWTNTFQNECQM